MDDFKLKDLLELLFILVGLFLLTIGIINDNSTMLLIAFFLIVASLVSNYKPIV